MKFTAATLLFGLLLALALFGCSKKLAKDPTPCFKVKRVAGICADVVLQIQDPKYYNLGEDNWPNTRDSNLLYDHVFFVGNYCAFEKSLAAAGIDPKSTDEFTVQLGTNADSDGCITCMAALASRPATKQSVVVVKACK